MSLDLNNLIFYHVYPIGFCGAPVNNDHVPSDRLKKLIEWIPHMKELGVNAIYLGPVFESEAHGYDTTDYFKIDTRLCSNETFREICDELHKNGIKIVLDGVFNHVGRQFAPFLDVKENLQHSEYCSWFQNLRFDSSNSFNDPFCYDTWAGYCNLVKLDMKNDAVVKYLLDAVSMWIDDFGIDGLRLDAADCIDIEFFKKLHNHCKNKNPDFWLMGEITNGDYNRWVKPGVLDSVTSYECYKAIHSSHNDKNYFELAHSLNRQFGKGGVYENMLLYTFADNHDVERIASTVKDKRDLYNIYTAVYSITGIPSVYYGSEWGITGKKNKYNDFDLRPCLELESDGYDISLFNHLKKLGNIRHSSDSLKYGNFENIIIRNEQLVYKRKSQSETTYIALNLSDSDYTVDFKCDCNKLYDILNDNYEFLCCDGNINVTIPAKSARILIDSKR